jgi:hypothetical protein
MNLRLHPILRQNLLVEAALGEMIEEIVSIGKRPKLRGRHG